MDFVERFPAAECREQAAQAENMIEVRMRQEDPVEALEADAAAEDLALRAFAAIDQETLFAGQDRQRRQAAIDRRRGGRCAEEDQARTSSAAFVGGGQWQHLNVVEKDAVAVRLIILENGQALHRCWLGDRRRR